MIIFLSLWQFLTVISKLISCFFCDGQGQRSSRPFLKSNCNRKISQINVLLKELRAFINVFTEVISCKVFTASLITKLSVYLNNKLLSLMLFAGTKVAIIAEKHIIIRVHFFYNAGYFHSPYRAPTKAFLPFLFISIFFSFNLLFKSK